MSTGADLPPSPSSKDGITLSAEKQHRAFACELIQDAAAVLKLPDVVAATAQTLLHRFFYRQSLVDFDALRTAMGCTFLAAKVEEQARTIREVVTVFYDMYQHRVLGPSNRHQALSIDHNGAAYSTWNNWLVLVERQILISLGFRLYSVMEHPHKFLAYYFSIAPAPSGVEKQSYVYLQSSFRIDVCVRYPADTIACAVIMLAYQEEQMAIDLTLFSTFEVEEKEVHAASKEILQVHGTERIGWLKPLTEIDPFEVFRPKENPPKTKEQDSLHRKKKSRWEPTERARDDRDRSKSREKKRSRSRSRRRRDRSRSRSRHDRRRRSSRDRSRSPSRDRARKASRWSSR